MTSQSEVILKVKKKARYLQVPNLRKRANIKEGCKVKANVVGDKLVIEAIPSIEEILKRPPVMHTTTRAIEKVGEEIQKEEGIYG